MAIEFEKPKSWKRIKVILKEIIKHPIIADIWYRLNYSPYSKIFSEKFMARLGDLPYTYRYYRAVAICSLFPDAPSVLQQLWPEMDPSELEKYLHQKREPKFSLQQRLKTEFSRKSPFTETGFQVDPHSLLTDNLDIISLSLPIRRNLPERNESNKTAD